jgi:LPXTG-motif cell wall-anchored protein
VKVMAKTLVLVLLLTVICSATYIAVLAEESPAANASALQRNFDYSVLFPKNNGENGGGRSNIENAPALRIDNKVVIPQETPSPTDEEDYIAPPQTGAVSDTFQILGAVALLGASLWLTKGRRLSAI